jgi:hypothetical protein
MLWDKNHPTAVLVRKLAYEKNRSYSTYSPYIEKGPPEVAANTIVSLIHQTNYLLDQQLRQLEGHLLKRAVLLSGSTGLEAQPEENVKVRVVANHMERESLEMDVVFVGAGPANLSGALHLTQLIEKAKSEGTDLGEIQIAVTRKGRVRRCPHLIRRGYGSEGPGRTDSRFCWKKEHRSNPKSKRTSFFISHQSARFARPLTRRR